MRILVNPVESHNLARSKRRVGTIKYVGPRRPRSSIALSAEPGYETGLIVDMGCGNGKVLRIEFTPQEAARIEKAIASDRRRWAASLERREPE